MSDVLAEALKVVCPYPPVMGNSEKEPGFTGLLLAQ